MGGLWWNFPAMIRAMIVHSLFSALSQPLYEGGGGNFTKQPQQDVQFMDQLAWLAVPFVWRSIIQRFLLGRRKVSLFYCITREWMKTVWYREWGVFCRRNSHVCGQSVRTACWDDGACLKQREKKEINHLL